MSTQEQMLTYAVIQELPISIACLLCDRTKTEKNMMTIAFSSRNAKKIIAKKLQLENLNKTIIRKQHHKVMSIMFLAQELATYVSAKAWFTKSDTQKIEYKRIKYKKEKHLLT